MGFKKRLISILSTCAVLTSMVPTIGAIQASAETTASLYYAYENIDVNQDSEINEYDLRIMQDYIGGKLINPSYTEKLSTLDLDEDGCIDIFDLALFRSKLIKYNEQYEIARAEELADSGEPAFTDKYDALYNNNDAQLIYNDDNPFYVISTKNYQHTRTWEPFLCSPVWNENYMHTDFMVDEYWYRLSKLTTWYNLGNGLDDELVSIGYSDSGEDDVLNFFFNISNPPLDTNISNIRGENLDEDDNIWERYMSNDETISNKSYSRYLNAISPVISEMITGEHRDFFIGKKIRVIKPIYTGVVEKIDGEYVVTQQGQWKYNVAYIELKHLGEMSPVAIYKALEDLENPDDKITHIAKNSNEAYITNDAVSTSNLDNVVFAYGKPTSHWGFAVTKDSYGRYEWPYEYKIKYFDQDYLFDENGNRKAVVIVPDGVASLQTEQNNSILVNSGLISKIWEVLDKKNQNLISANDAIAEIKRYADGLKANHNKLYFGSDGDGKALILISDYTASENYIGIIVDAKESIAYLGLDDITGPLYRSRFGEVTIENYDNELNYDLRDAIFQAVASIGKGLTSSFLSKSDEEQKQIVESLINEANHTHALVYGEHNGKLITDYIITDEAVGIMIGGSLQYWI